MSPVFETSLDDALDGIYAYDDGCIDSGIRDARLWRWCVEQIRSWPDARAGLEEVAGRLFVLGEYGGEEDVADGIESFTDYWLEQVAEAPAVWAD